VSLCNTESTCGDHCLHEKHWFFVSTTPTLLEPNYFPNRMPSKRRLRVTSSIEDSSTGRKSSADFLNNEHRPTPNGNSRDDHRDCKLTRRKASPNKHQSQPKKGPRRTQG
jgi:hypothetical protein